MTFSCSIYGPGRLPLRRGCNLSGVLRNGYGIGAVRLFIMNQSLTLLHKIIKSCVCTYKYNSVTFRDELKLALHNSTAFKASGFLGLFYGRDFTRTTLWVGSFQVNPRPKTSLFILILAALNAMTFFSHPPSYYVS